MEQPSELEPLVKELALVRRRGIARVEVVGPRLERLELPILRHLAEIYSGLEMTFIQRLEGLILKGIGGLTDDTDRETAFILFGFLEELPSGYQAKRLEDPNPDELRKEAREFYSKMRVGAEGMEADTFRKGAELWILSNLAAQIKALARPKPQTIDPTAEDLLVERSTFHVVRTLEVRRSHLIPLAAEVLDDVLKRFRDWHLMSRGDAGQLIRELGWLCERYFGRGIYDLVGSIRVDAEPPEVPPQDQLPWCTYPSTSSLSLIPGGVDCFTGEEVAPFYMAVFPVTAFEWADFLRRFNWQASDTWRSTFGTTDLRERRHDIGRFPAFGMTYYDCLTYCFWLWATTAYRFRLPTEAEWNFAATGGTNLRFPWGNSLSEAIGWFADSLPGVRSPAAVDVIPPTGPYGIVGLAGNVWEYVSTLWRGDQPIPGSNVEVPDLPFAFGHEGWWTADDRLKIRPDNFSWREEVRLVMKGGSWGGGPEYAAMDSRIYSSFYNYGGYGGFRLVVSAVRNPHTGAYEMEQSPLINGNLQQVRLLSSADFAQRQQQGLTFSGCGGTLSPGKVSPITTVSWDAQLRSNDKKA